MGLSTPGHEKRANNVLPSLTKKTVSPDTSMSSCPTSAPSTLQDCLAETNVPVYFISSSGFSQLAQPYNLRLAYTPAVIVVPTTTQHIIDAVLCAGANNVKVQAKSGGHSYASYSSGGQNGSMVIDLRASKPSLLMRMGLRPSAEGSDSAIWHWQFTITPTAPYLMAPAPV